MGADLRPFDCQAMSQPDPNRLQSLIEQAGRLPLGEREAYVRSECGDDESMIQEVMTRLRSIEAPFDPDATIDMQPGPDADATIDIEPGVDADATVDLDAGIEDAETIDPTGAPSVGARRDDEGLPEQINDFRILGLLGKGGMGAVYLADQLNPRRRVALKVIRAKLISEDALKRFEVEGHTLAKLSHPGVAQVFSAGIHEEDGASVPFFAMEYVADADEITTWVESQGLTQRQRLELFADVCEAVAHGHQRGVIHRDLKPQNILVNESGQMKVIDFGVAQVEEDNESGIEQKRQIVGTLQYMPPEQVRGEIDIDTSSDVYALGIVLYQMLVGKVPYEIDRTSVSAATTSIIEAPTPSVLDVKPECGRDLDAIIKKALAKDREDRYRTAADFGDDIRRVLADEPIIARQQTTGEAIRRFMRKNRAAASAIAVVMLVIVVGLVAVSIFAYRTEIARAEEQRQRGIADSALKRVEAEKERLEKIVAFQSEMISKVEPAEMGRSLVDEVVASVRDRLQEVGVPTDEIDVEVRAQRDMARKYNPTEVAVQLIDEHILKRALAAVPRQFAEDLETEADVREIVADAYMQLGRYALASAEYERALDIRTELYGREDSRALESISDLGWSRMSQGRNTDARSLLTEAMEGRRKVLGPRHEKTIASLQHMGVFCERVGEYDEAEKWWKEGFELSKEVNGESHPVSVLFLGNLGVLYTRLGRVDDAEPLIQRDYELSREMLGEEAPETLKSKRNVAQIAFMRGNINEAAKLISETVESYRSVLGDRHPDTLSEIDFLGAIRLQQGRIDDGIELFRVVYERRMEILGEDHPDTFQSLQQLGQSYIIGQDLMSALPFVRKIVAQAGNRFGESDARTLVWLDGLALILRDTDQFEESENALDRLAEICSSSQSVQELGVCGSVPDRYVRLYTLWHEVDPDGGYDELALEWEQKGQPVDLNAN